MQALAGSAILLQMRLAPNNKSIPTWTSVIAVWALLSAGVWHWIGSTEQSNVRFYTLVCDRADHPAAVRLNGSLLVGQPLSTTRPVSYFSIRFATYQKKSVGRLTAVLLRGAQSPKSMDDLESRQVGQWSTDAATIKDNSFWRINLSRGPRGGDLYLVVYCRDAAADRPITVWLDQKSKSRNRAAELISSGPSGLQAKPLAGRLSIRYGLDVKPTILQTVLVNSWGVCLLAVGCLLLLAMVAVAVGHVQFAGVTSVVSHERPGLWMTLSLCLAMTAALILDLAFRTVFYGATDDSSYYSAAYYFSQLQIHYTYHDAKIYLTNGAYAFDFAGLRFIITIPLALLTRLGGGLTAASIFFASHHVGLVWLCYLLGRTLINRPAGTLAAWLAAVNPLLFVFAGGPFPDIVQAFWLMLAVYLAVRFHFVPGADPSNPAKRLLITGFCLGLAYSAKQSALMYLIPFAGLVWLESGKLFSRRTIFNGCALALGMAAYLALESTLLWIMFGQPTTRGEIVFNRASYDIYHQALALQGVWPHERLLTFVRQAGEYLNPIHLVVFLGAFASALLVKRLRWFSLLFIAWPFLFQTLGSASLGSYAPPTIQARYYAQLMGPLSVLAAGIICLGFIGRSGRRGGRWSMVAGSVVISIMALTSVIQNWSAAGNVIDGAQSRSFLNAAELIKTKWPEKPVYTSNWPQRKALTLNWRQPYGPMPSDPCRVVRPYLFLTPMNMVFQQPNIADFPPLSTQPCRTEATYRLVAYDQVYNSRLDRYYNFLYQALGRPAWAPNPIPPVLGHGVFLIKNRIAGTQNLRLADSDEGLIPVSLSPPAPGARLRPNGRGYLLNWSLNPGDGTLRLTTGLLAYSSAPTSFLFRFPIGQGSYTALVDVINKSKRPVDGRIQLHLYRDRRKVRMKEKKIVLADSINRLQLVLDTDQPVDGYRMVLFLNPPRNVSGEIELNRIVLAHRTNQ